MRDGSAKAAPYRSRRPLHPARQELLRPEVADYYTRRHVSRLRHTVARQPFWAAIYAIISRLLRPEAAAIVEPGRDGAAIACRTPP